MATERRQRADARSFTHVGRALLDVLQILGEATRLFADTLAVVRFAPRDRDRIAVQIVRIGTDALAMGALLSLFVGMTMVIQTADQLRDVSQTVLGPIVGITMTKELGPVLMGFLLAGRAGSAMAAEIGAMVVYDEVNALRTMDIDPVRFLCLPRFLAATLTLPVLSLYSDFIGVAGGAAVVAVDPVIKISVHEYLARMLEWVHFQDLAIGFLKAFVFGAVVSIVPCTFGLRTRGGTQGVAVSTTAAVVWSFILILVLDFLIVRACVVIT